MGAESLTGYRRSDERVGIRNHVAVLPVDDLSNAVCEAVSRAVPGTVPLSHSYGRMQYGDDLELTFRTLIGTGANPNVAAAVVVGVEETWATRLAEGIAKTGKPVEMFASWRTGEIETAARATRAAARLLREASSLQREQVSLPEVMLSMKCGESDTTSALASCPVTGAVSDAHVAAGGTMIFGETAEMTGGEQRVAARCADRVTRERFLGAYERYSERIKSAGVDVLGTQPTLGNIRGGLTTIEEKAIGTISKTGSEPVVGALDPAQAPGRAGLNFMDTSASAGETATLMSAAGAVLHLFPTGGGNVVGHPIQPVLKITANPITVETMSEHTDVDICGLLRGEYGLAEAVEIVRGAVEATINGRLTCAETLGHRELILTKLFPSA